MYKFRTQYNNEPSINELQYEPGISLTVPDMSYTVQQIMDKFTSGNVPDIQNNNMAYDDEPSFDDITRPYDLDLADISALKAELEIRLQSLQAWKKKQELLSKKIEQEVLSKTQTAAIKEPATAAATTK